MNRLGLGRLTRDRGGEHLPVVFGVVVARVERDAVLVADGWVEGALHVVDGLRHEVERELAVGVEVVEQAVGVVGAVVEGRVRWVGVVSDAQVLPLRDVAVGGSGVVGCIYGVAGEVGDGGHGLDADHALEGEVGLVGERAGEVVGGDLVGGVE